MSASKSAALQVVADLDRHESLDGRGESTGEVGGAGTASMMSPGSSEQVAERTEMEIQVVTIDAEGGHELVHRFVEPDERDPEQLGLVVRAHSSHCPAHRLAIHQLPEEFDNRKYELG
jgi:hypothetical protein